MSKFVVDVEATGPCPGLYSMISFGIVLLEDPGVSYFSELMKPLPDSQYINEAMAVTKTDWYDMLEFGRDITEVMTETNDWILQNNTDGRPMFFSDNNGFDWQFMNYYFHYAIGENPFGHSSTNINSVYKGMKHNMRKNCKHLRKTKHTHHPVDDARGNAEALQAMIKEGLSM